MEDAGLGLGVERSSAESREQSAGLPLGQSQDWGSHRDAERNRVARRYLKNTNVPQVGSPAWVSQREAARRLNVSVLRVGLLIANEHLEPAEDGERNMGVTLISLAAERRWRRETPLALRLLRPFRDAVNWL